MKTYRYIHTFDSSIHSQRKETGANRWKTVPPIQALTVQAYTTLSLSLEVWLAVNEVWKWNKTIKQYSDITRMVVSGHSWLWWCLDTAGYGGVWTQLVRQGRGNTKLVSRSVYPPTALFTWPLHRQFTSLLLALWLYRTTTTWEPLLKTKCVLDQSSATKLCMYVYVLLCQCHHVVLYPCCWSHSVWRRSLNVPGFFPFTLCQMQPTNVTASLAAKQKVLENVIIHVCCFASVSLGFWMTS